MQFLKNLKKLDQRLIQTMQRIGHQGERYLIGSIFFWFGSLKVLGETSATSIIAKSIYWFDGNWMVQALGAWEIIIGLSLIFPPLIRLSILLLFIRFPGTLLALVYHYSECFDESIFIPTIQGQYLLKELTLIGAALVIGGSLKTQQSKSISQ